MGTHTSFALSEEDRAAGLILACRATPIGDLGDITLKALDVLNDREKDILTQRRLSEETVTLEDLSGQYDVSRERIRQIEVRAFEKLQSRMQELASERGLAETA